MGIKLLRKIIFMVLLINLIIICLFSISALAQNLFYDGEWHEYTADPTYLKINGQNLSMDVPPVIFKDRSVVPARAVFESLGADVSWDGNNSVVGIAMNNTEIMLKINDNKAIVNGIEHEMDIAAKIINDRTMIPTRFIGETLGMNIGWIGEQRVITIDKVKEDIVSKDININNIDYSINNNLLRITISCDKKINEYSSFELDNHPRLVLDIKDAILNFEKSNIDVNNISVNGIRMSQYEINPNTTRVVVDLKNWQKYDIKLSEDKKDMYIDFDVEESVISDIEFKGYSKYDSIEVYMENNREPSIFRLSNPDRIILDFTGTVLNISERKENINSSYVNSIRYGQFDENTTRIVLDVKGQPFYELKQYDDKIRIDVKKPTIRDIYYSNEDKPQFTIDSTAVAENFDQTLIDGNTYVVSVNLSKADFGEGRLHINDGQFEYVDVVKNSDTQKTDFIFKSSKPHIYEIKKIGSKTIITATEGNMLIKDEAYTDFEITASMQKNIIVLDAGHGGKDPGAVYGSVREKDLNLDIVLKLYEMLEESGIRVYLTRKTDVFVDLYDRSDYANDLKADLFISVHNNAMSEADYDGTMTLYFGPSGSSNNGLTSKEFADMVQKEMVSHLGTTDRGLRERPRLVVLRETKMPAILAEVAFLTNDSDRDSLCTDEFRTRAAEAIYVGILKALKDIS